MKKIYILFAACALFILAVLPASPAFAQGTAPAQSSPQKSNKVYAALGDSVAAGLGLVPKINPTGNDTSCGRSRHAYAHNVATRVNMSLVNAACSGATAGDMFTAQGVDGPNIPAQLDTAFASGTPSLITITAGANDAHWADFIRGCYATNCANEASTLLANGYLVILQAKLHVAFSSIYLRSGGNPPTVIMTGYYNPLSQKCTKVQQNITSDEITWLAGETNALNQTIKDVAANYSFVRFAPVDFSGHDLCSADSWVQGLADNAPFHPTARGQQAYANAVMRAYKR